MKQYALVIDDESCWGCRTCEVACKQEFNVLDGVRLISVSEDGPKMVDGKLDFVFRVNVCQHCEEPPCIDACPEGVIFERKDGIVVLDYELCTGANPAQKPVLTMQSISTREKTSHGNAISVIAEWIAGLYWPAPTISV